jgi:hypothetical protein
MIQEEEEKKKKKNENENNKKSPTIPPESKLARNVCVIIRYE